jgi:two-component system, cell cycle sensor histidine kinase and response regulator CckA
VTGTKAGRRAQRTQAHKLEAIGLLTGGIAHDFNNLLSIIIGNLDLLLEQSRSDPEAVELARDALAAALCGADLTRSLLALVRRQPLRAQCPDVNEVITGLARVLSRGLGEHISVELSLAPGVWPVVIERAQLESAITNLASNARDAMPRGGRLSIATRNSRIGKNQLALHPRVKPGHYVVVEVSDNGTGMPPAVAERIFEPFFTTKKPADGSGLGLSIVADFVQQSRGRLSVQTELGRGTMFRLYLPRSPKKIVRTTTAAPSSEGSKKNATILVVEDNVRLRRVVVRQLVKAGYQVAEADGANAALSILVTHRPIDLLFSDIVIPGEMDGRELARAALALRPALRVVLTSGYSSPAPAAGERMPQAAVLSKPYRREELIRTVRVAIEAPDGAI